MEYDFMYCPRCTRYSVFHWVRGWGRWECEDCAYKPPKEEPEEVLEWTSAAMSRS